jgi:hypothetical protein
MEARIAVDGRDLDRESLWDWLRCEPELRGRLRLGSSPAPAGTMGATAELVVQASAALAGASALWIALARSLTVWLVQRRSDVTITVTGPSGRTVSVSASRVDSAEQILRSVLEADAAVPSSRPEPGI